MNNNKKRLALLALLRLRKKRKLNKQPSTRRYWVHPMLEVRYVEGAFYTTFNKLLEDEIKFFNYFRMSFGTFNNILDQIADLIRRQDTQLRLCVPPKEMLVITIRYETTN
ncbi:hypothetical protein QTP88_001492 [Uroleucon formosanum]